MNGSKAAAPRTEWGNIAFLALTPLLGIPGTAWYTWKTGFHPWMLFLFLGMYLAVGLSICAGYHRFFAHKSYECSRPVQAFFAFFGALAAQNSALTWCSGHRTHHHYVDRDWDPYNIKRGFWWAHIVWIFHSAPDKDARGNVRDLEKNPILRWQDRWYKVILIVGGFGIPTAIGALFGNALAGLFWGGFLRIAVIHHTTFFVNSLAHSFGTPSYDSEISARDNWMLALVTLGEGYHSFHHRFPSDFRNGVRWYDWDPAKWFIGTLRLAGLAARLRRTDAPAIERARLEADIKVIESRLGPAPVRHGEEVLRQLAKARQTLEHAFLLWRQHLEERSRGLSRAWRATRRTSRRRVRQARRERQSALRLFSESVAA